MMSMTNYFGHFLYNSFSPAKTGEFTRNTAVNTGEKCSKPSVCQVWTQLSYIMCKKGSKILPNTQIF